MPREFYRVTVEPTRTDYFSEAAGADRVIEERVVDPDHPFCWSGVQVQTGRCGVVVGVTEPSEDEVPVTYLGRRSVRDLTVSLTPPDKSGTCCPDGEVQFVLGEEDHLSIEHDGVTIDVSELRSALRGRR